MQNVRKHSRRNAPLRRIGGMLAAGALTVALLNAEDHNRDMLVLTSTNATTNDVVIFKLDKMATLSLTLANILPTGGAGGATGNAGAKQFRSGIVRKRDRRTLKISRRPLMAVFAEGRTRFILLAGRPSRSRRSLDAGLCNMASPNCQEGPIRSPDPTPLANTT